MTSASQASDYNLDLNLNSNERVEGDDLYGTYRRVDLDYQPTGTLELDTRPMPKERVAELRKQTRRPPSDRNQIDYLSQRELAANIGVPASTVSMWEAYHNDELGGLLSAMIRLHFHEGVTFEHEACPCDWVRAVAYAVGGYETLAEETGRDAMTCRQWAMDSHGTGAKGGAGPVLRYIFQDMALEPLEEWPSANHTSLEPHEVREIRRIYHSTDLGYARTGRKAGGYTKRQVRSAVNAYEWVE